LRARRRLAVGAALTVLVATLVHDALVPAQLSHPRPLAVLLGAVAVGSLLLLLVPRVPSAAMAAGAGVAAGGAFATCVAGLAWSAGVPDPISRGGLAFNLADVSIALGDALLLTGLLLHAWTNRARLREPI
jgi:lipoprotein signal peptidase